MIVIGILIGMLIGYFIHGLMYKNFGNIIFNDEDMKMLFEFSRSPDDIPKYKVVSFSVYNIRRNIDSSNGKT